MSEATPVVQLAQLRARIAAFARGGRYDLAIGLLGELARVDLALGLAADGVQRARQAVQLADERGEPSAGPLIVLAATLLAADSPDAAIDACALAIERTRSTERPRVELLARLVGGAAQRRANRLAAARTLLDSARGAAARIGETRLAALALAELAWIDLAEDRPDAAATCFEFAARFFAHGHGDGDADAELDAGALATACWIVAGDDTGVDEFCKRARAAKRPELAAYVDGVVAELALRRNSPQMRDAIARAAASAEAARDANALAHALSARARLRQARTSLDPADRARHLEAGIELALALDRRRAGAELGTLMIALVEDAARTRTPPALDAIARLAAAIEHVGDASLADLAGAVLAEVAR
ncbi:MAG TPA: hypothetical protein VH143_26400 [Kofleriaceae bacterium]|nr:hypothetical protein [Kofleriaceae bacterium]